MKFSPEGVIYTPKEKLSQEATRRIIRNLDKFFDDKTFIKNGEGRDIEYFVIYRDGEPRNYLLKFRKLPVLWEEGGKQCQSDEHIEDVLEARLRFPDSPLIEAVRMVKKEHRNNSSSLSSGSKKDTI